MVGANCVRPRAFEERPYELSVGEGLAPPADYNEREAKRLPYKQILAEGCSSADFVV